MSDDFVMKFKVGPRLPDFPGHEKTYPKFARTDNKTPSVYDDVNQLQDAVRQELRVLLDASRKARTPFIVRLQIRQLSALLDSFFSSLNVYSERKIETGEIKVSHKERKALNGQHGVMDYYRHSIKVFARSHGIDSPLGGQLQMGKAAYYWPRLRAHITHPKRLAHYQITACENAILRSILEWYGRVNDWALELRLAEIDDVKKRVNQSLDDLRSEIMRSTQKGP